MGVFKNQISKSITTYLVITFSLSSIFYYLSINGMSELISFGIMWCPGVSALITMIIFKRNLKEVGWKWGKSKYQGWSYIIPILYTTIAYLIVWIFGLGKFYNENFVKGISGMLGFGPMEDEYIIVLYVLLSGTVGMVPNAFFALGEEIGWRGFLVPELYKSQGFTKTSLISGFIWAIWHLPIIIFSEYNNGTPIWFAVPCFIVMIVSISFIFTWFRIKSGSIWTAVILHAAHNLYIQNVFTPLTTDTGNTAYYIDEFGIIIPLTTMVFAFYFWAKRKEIDLKPNIT